MAFRHTWARPRPRWLTSCPNPRWLVGRLALAVFVLCSSSMLIFYALPQSRYKYAPMQLLDDYWLKRMPNVEPAPPLAKRVPCYGPRGKFLSASPDDELRSVELNITYPASFIGSHTDLGLEQSWMSADGRYGPYGYGEGDVGNSRSKVDWDKVDWGRLQNQCFEQNQQRFPTSAAGFTNEMRFGLRENAKVPTVRKWDEFTNSRRTAIVVRAYQGYRYKPEDMFSLRSLIAEASLRTGGEYTVVLLVDIKGKESNIFESKESYWKAFEDAKIPKEFQSIAILWDENLLRNWYPKVLEHRTEYQVFQPLQLFAQHYPEFDHFWQLEMDLRFLGDAGKYLDAVSAFARAEPRKQALERSTFPHVPTVDGDYATFAALVDSANQGASHVWGPMRIPDIKPIGPIPPLAHAEEDTFRWGVGEDADVVATSFCANATSSPSWVYRDWIGGFRNGIDTPRFFCPPAIMRASRALLLAVHAAQLQQGLRVPSEATLPSFALWHGLKLSYPPQPVYLRVRGDEALEAAWHRGGPANASATGLGPADPQHPSGDGLTWWWESKWPRLIVDSWFEGGAGPDQELPYLLAEVDGRVYAPNVAMHPVKTQ